MKGRRLSDLPIGDIHPNLRPGDYWKLLKQDGSRPLSPDDWLNRPEPTNLTRTCWIVACPGATEDGYLLATLIGHTVREHEDGTISVRPGDGSSNSILARRGYDGPSWHGYIEHDEFLPCGN